MILNNNMAGEIKIVVADTSYLTRKGLQILLSENADFQLVAEVEHYTGLIEQLNLNKASLLITDSSCAEFNIENIQYILKKFPQINVLAITPELHKNVFSKALESGVTSYLLKDCDKDEITEAIYKTAKGEKFICGKVLDAIMNEPKESLAYANVVSCDGINITDREAEIIQLVAEGHSNKLIADKLFLSPHTVTTHRKNIMGKLKVTNTAGLVLFAVRNNLLGPNKFLFSSKE